MRILASAISFGLGPSGKLASIISASNDEWYACGDELDLSLYGESPFVDYCWSKNLDTIDGFIRRYDISVAIVVLDPEMASILLSLGVKVIYIDSIPFVWTLDDPIPYNVSFYCAQKYPDYRVSEALRPIGNLVWINPIIASRPDSPKADECILINFGGLHSPIGDSPDYLEIVLPSILPFFIGEKVIISGGRNVVQYCKVKYPDLQCHTFSHDAFLALVSSAKVFVTSPGLTTIYETCCFDIPTILLPAQNLSQMYNTEIAQKVLGRYKRLEWCIPELSHEHLERFSKQPESTSVEFIYDRIKCLNGDKDYLSLFRTHIRTIMEGEYQTNEKHGGPMDGVQEVLRLLSSLNRAE